MPPHRPDAPCDRLPAGARLAAEALGLHGCCLQQLGLCFPFWGGGGAVGCAHARRLLGG